MADTVVRVGGAGVSGLKGLAVSPVPVKRHRCSFNLNGCSQQSYVEGLFVGAGPYHHGLFDEDFPTGVAVYTRSVWDEVGDLFVTDRGRPGCQGCTGVGLGFAFFRGDYLGFIKDGDYFRHCDAMEAVLFSCSFSGFRVYGPDEKPPGLVVLF